MNRKSLLLYVVFLLNCWNIVFCQQKKVTFITPRIKTIDTLFKGELSLRAIVIDNHKLWYATTKSRIGYIDWRTSEKKQFKIPDTTRYEFRSISQTSKAVYFLSIGNPASLFRLDKKDFSIKKVYEEQHPKVFYDCLSFWNQKEGMAVGDPIDNCLSLLITHNGGLNWTKMSCDSLPQTFQGEAVFAASNSTLCSFKSNTWVVTGGSNARVFYSKEKGKNWTVYTTPIAEGTTMKGIFSVAFYDENTGYIVGGDYEKPDQDFSNKAQTTDGGTTWHLKANHSGFGYASCVQYAPKSKGKKLLVVGATGVFYSIDGGNEWEKLLNDTTFYTLRFIDSKTVILAGKNYVFKMTLN